MSGEQQQQPGPADALRGVKEAAKPVSELIRGLLESGEADKAVALSVNELERSKLELAKTREVMITDEGRMVAHSLSALKQIGQLIANAGEMIPRRFQRKPDDCALAHQFCQSVGIDTVSSLPSIYIVHGKPAVEGKLAIAILNVSSEIEGRVSFEIGCNACQRVMSASETVCAECKSDDAIRCTATAKDKRTKKDLSFTIDMDMVRSEGWDKDDTGQDGTVYPSKWNTMRILMFHYRAGAFLQRVHFPEILFGMQTVEEMQDVAIKSGDAASTVYSSSPNVGIGPETQAASPLAGLTPTSQQAPPAEAKSAEAKSADDDDDDKPAATDPDEAAEDKPVADDESEDAGSVKDDDGEADGSPVFLEVNRRIGNAMSDAGRANIIRKAREGHYGDLTEEELASLPAE